LDGDCINCGSRCWVCRVGLCARCLHRPWSDDDVAALRALKATGVSHEQVGIRMKRSPGAIQSKCRELGLPRRRHHRQYVPSDEGLVRERLELLAEGWPAGCDRTHAAVLAVLEEADRPLDLVEVHAALGGGVQIAATREKLRECLNENWVVQHGGGNVKRRWSLAETTRTGREIHAANVRHDLEEAAWR
jgi:hypothetical protein